MPTCTSLNFSLFPISRSKFSERGNAWNIFEMAYFSSHQKIPLSVGIPWGYFRGFAISFPFLKEVSWSRLKIIMKKREQTSLNIFWGKECWFQNDSSLVNELWKSQKRRKLKCLVTNKMKSTERREIKHFGSHFFCKQQSGYQLLT